MVIIALCLLCYTQSKKLNIFQTVLGHVVFAHNILKYAVETFYQTSWLILYKSIYHVIVANASAIEAKLREKVQKYSFFILYNNMNFDKHMHDAQMSN